MLLCDQLLLRVREKCQVDKVCKAHYQRAASAPSVYMGTYTANTDRIKGAHETDAQRLAKARNAWTARATRIQRTASELHLAAAAQWPVLPAVIAEYRTPRGADHHRPSEGDIKMPPKTKTRKAITDAGARGRGRAGRETRNNVLLQLTYVGVPRFHNSVAVSQDHPCFQMVHTASEINFVFTMQQQRRSVYDLALTKSRVHHIPTIIVPSAYSAYI